MEFVLSFLGTIAALIVWSVARSYFPSYLTEKGKNLATKEDVEDITRRIEEVKHTYASSLEDQKQRGQLRFAALDRRLEAAQQAYIRWWHLLHALHTPDVTDEVLKCQAFWVDNRLYLSEEIAFALRQAYMAAGNHESLKDASRHDKTVIPEVRENFKRITETESIIIRSVAIPSLNDLPVADELKKQA